MPKKRKLTNKLKKSKRGIKGTGLVPDITVHKGYIFTMSSMGSAQGEAQGRKTWI